MNFKKVKVTQKPKQLTATWTVDLQPGEIEFSEGLEEELAKTLAEEIDWEITSSLLVENGWTQVIIPEKADILVVWSWVRDNIKGKNTHLRYDWVFEKQEDAIWFKLRWA